MTKIKIIMPFLALAISLSTIFTACTKTASDKDAPAKVTLYYPQSIYANNTLIDSFVYNQDFTVKTMYSHYLYGSLLINNNGLFEQRLEFQYDQNRRCIKVQGYDISAGNLTRNDSIVYKSDSIIIYVRGAYYNLDSSNLYKVDANNLIIQEKTTDTLRNSTEKFVNYTQYTYSNGNISSMFSQYYFSRYRESSFNIDQHIQFTYDSKLNPLGVLALKNPIVTIYLHQSNNKCLLIPAVNNIQSVTLAEAPIGTYNIDNTYDTLNYLISQHLNIPSKSEYTLKYNLIPGN